MERDKRGRFVKKFQNSGPIVIDDSINYNDGSTIEIDGIKYKIKLGANLAYDAFKQLHKLNDYSFLNYLKNFGNTYLEYVPLDIENLPKLSENLPKLSENFALNTPLYTPEYHLNEKGLIVDQFGKSYMDSINLYNRSSINFKFNTFQNSSNDEKKSSAGRTDLDKRSFGEFLRNTFSKPIDKEKLANFLDFAKVGTGTSINNKVTERALEAEKPFLQNISESHRSIYGDYRSQIEGEKAAAQLRNIASQPITSDGALLQDMMLKAQLEGLNFINQGLEQDDALKRQTQEMAWQQEKENQNLRLSTAMLNKQAMLESEKNKANLENVRDSGNYSQIIEPFISTQELRLRNEAIQKEQLEQQYKDARVVQDVWINYNFGDDPNADKYDQIRTDYINGGVTAILENIANNLYTQADYNAVTRLINNEILRKKAEIQGISLNDPTSTSGYGLWDKKGGTLHKVVLTKRIKDNDRGSKSIESSKKIAAKFLEKALDSLYTYKNIELIAKAKTNKRKYQSGGGLPLVGYTPIFATNENISPRQTKSETETKEEGLTTKDLLDLLKTSDILKSDFIRIQQLLSNFTITDSMDPLGIDSSNIASRYILIIGKIKEAKANKDWFDKAYEKLRDNNALNEYAITSTGLFIGVKEGNYEYFSMDEIEQGKLNGYLLLTNSNLLNIRANDPSVAFNSEIITEIANGISIESVTEYINKTIQNLGSEKNLSQIFGDQSKEVLAGLLQLQNIAREVGQDLSISLLYEANIMNENLVKQAQLAINYLINSLPSNMKALLLAKTGSKRGAIDLITSLVNSKLSSTYKLEFSPKKSNSKSKTGTGTSTGIDGLDLSPAQMLLRGYGERETIVIQNSTSTGLKVDAIKMPITKNGNDTIGSGTLEDVSRSQYGGILDFTNASMGKHVIPFEGRRNIAVDGTKIYSMYLPIDLDEFYSTGNIVPDLDLVDKLNKVNQIIKEKQITDISEINAIYELSGLPTYLTDSGNVIPTSYRRFGVLNGTAINRAFGINDKILKDNKFLKEVDNENLINGAIDIMNHGRNAKDKIDFDGGWFGDDVMYQGTIFIPISNDVFAGIAGNGQMIASEVAEDLYEKQQLQQRVNATYINPGELQ